MAEKLARPLERFSALNGEIAKLARIIADNTRGMLILRSSNLPYEYVLRKVVHREGKDLLSERAFKVDGLANGKRQASVHVTDRESPMGRIDFRRTKDISLGDGIGPEDLLRVILKASLEFCDAEYRDFLESAILQRYAKRESSTERTCAAYISDFSALMKEIENIRKMLEAETNVTAYCSEKPRKNCAVEFVVAQHIYNGFKSDYLVRERKYSLRATRQSSQTVDIVDLEGAVGHTVEVEGSRRRLVMQAGEVLGSMLLTAREFVGSQNAAVMAPILERYNLSLQNSEDISSVPVGGHLEEDAPAPQI